jgi:hypothetical protein
MPGAVTNHTRPLDQLANQRQKRFAAVAGQLAGVIVAVVA